MIRIRLPTGMTRSVMRVASASVVAQGVALAVSPVLTRLYEPSAFGVFAYVTALVTTIGVVAGLRFEMAIPICQSDGEAAQVARLAMSVALAFCLLLTVPLPFVGAALDDRSSLDLMPYLWWLPPSVLALALFTIMSQLSIRGKDFRAVARRNITQAWTTAAVQVVMGLRPSPSGLLAGQALGRGLAAGLLGWTNRSILRAEPVATASVVLRRYWRFPVLFAPSAILNTMGLTLPVLMIGTWFGAEAAGQFDLAAKVVLGPAVILGAAVSQVLLGEMAHRRRTSDATLAPLFRTVAWRLIAVAVPFMLTVALTAPWAFPIVFGAEWEQAGEYARLMAPAAAMSLVAGPLSQVFFVLEQGTKLIFVDTIRVLLLVGAGGTAYLQGGSQAMVAGMILGAMFLSQVVSFIASWRVITVHDAS